jgi:1-pyrroline-5-carboxylate dehydrogenase
VRAAIFKKAAVLLAGPYRDLINAATMLNQSKSVYQAEIDSAAELVDFYNFNTYYMQEIYEDQPPYSPEGQWNRVEQRPLEGFYLRHYSV